MTSSGQCARCPQNCTNCTQNPTNNEFECVACADYSTLVNKKCVLQWIVDSCLVNTAKYYGKGGKYWSIGCWDCPTGCNYCSYDNNLETVVCNATSCKSGYEYDSSSRSCVIQETRPVECASGQMLVYDPYGTAYCKNCSSECKTCKYDSLNQRVVCLTCQSGYNYSQELQGCVKVDEVVTCMTGCDPTGCSRNPMDPNNPSILYSTICSNCTEGYTLINGQCFMNCGQGQKAVFNESQMQMCMDCQPGCQNCYIDYLNSPPMEICTVCSPEYYLTGKQCKLLPQCGYAQYLTYFYNNSMVIPLCMNCPRGNSFHAPTHTLRQAAVHAALLCARHPTTSLSA